MSSTKRIFTAAATFAAGLALGALLASALPVSAAIERGGFGAGFRPGMIAERIAQRLDLTDDQRSEIRDILHQAAPDLAVGAERVKDTRLALFDTIHQHPPVETDVRQASAAVAAAEADLAVLRSEVADDLYGVLTPAQQEEAAKMRADAVSLFETVAARVRQAVEDRLGPF